MSASSVHQEIKDTFQLFWVKLQQLPKADVVEIVGFSLIILFIVTVLLIMCIACCQCCCGKKKRPKKIRIQPVV